MRKILRITRISLAAVIIALAAMTLLPPLFGIKGYIVRSGSMEPAIQTGALAFVNTNEDYDKVLPGDVVAFAEPDGSMVAHRATQRTDEGIATKGDANDVGDGVTVTRDNYRGNVIFTIPYMGYAAARLGAAGGRALAIMAVIILILMSVFTGMFEDDDEKPGPEPEVRHIDEDKVPAGIMTVREEKREREASR